MNEKKKIILGSLAVLAALFVCYIGFEYLMYVETDNAQVEAPTVMLAAKVNGYLIKIHTSEGQKVKKDQILVEIDSRDYQSMFQAAQSELESLEARRKDVERNYIRLKQLHAENVISAQQYDTSLANYNEIRAKYDSALARVTQSKLNLENTQIKAPSDGIIAKTSAEVGQLTAVGVPLIGFVSSESRWITANFKETDIRDIKIGNRVDINIDAISRRKFEGEVQSISPSTGATFTLLPPDNATGNFTKVVQRIPVRIKFNNISVEDYEVIRAGLSAQVKVHIH